MEINGYYLDDVYDTKATPPKLIGKKGDLVPNFVSLRRRRIHVERELALQRELHPEGRKGRQHDGPQGEGGSDRPRPLSELGVGMAAEPEDHLQPGFRRPERESMGPEPPGHPMGPGGPATGKPGGWAGDVPDGPAPPLANEKEGKLPFIMKPLGVGSIFGKDLADGPFPEHYEPLESPVPANPMSKKHRVNPTIPLAKLQAMAKDPSFLFSFDYKRYPYRGDDVPRERTLADGRHDPPPPLAAGDAAPDVRRDGQGSGGGKGDQKRRHGGGDIRRGRISCPAIVTDRFRPFRIMDTTVHLVGLPWHFGWQFPEDGSGGDSANLLVPFLGDPNTLIPESKAFMVNISRLAETSAAPPAAKTKKSTGR